jgi:hypothetical protein
MSSHPDSIPILSSKNPMAAKSRPLFARIVTDRLGLASLIILASIIAGLCFIVATPMYLRVFRPSVAQGRSYAAATIGRHGPAGSPDDWVTVDGECPSDAWVVVEADATQFTAASSTIKFTVHMTASDKLLDGTSSIRLSLPTPNASLVLEVGNVKKTYRTGDQASDTFDVSQIVLVDGDYGAHAFYPFDQYMASLYMEVYLSAVFVVDGRNITRHLPAPACFAVSGALPSLHLAQTSSNNTYADNYDVINANSQVGGQSSFIHVEYSLSRTITTKVFSIWINIIMWALGSCMFGMVIDHMFLRPRDPLLGVLGVSTSMLFSLPPLRNLQADAPPVGAAVDVMCFYWAQSMAALSALLLMCYVVSGYKPK